MRSPPRDLAVPDLERAVAAAWGIAAVSSRYVPEGGGSHHWTFIDGDDVTHFVTVDDLDDKSWMGDDRDTVFTGLTQALRTSLALRNEAGLDFVVAPTPATDGEPTVRVTDRYTVSAFPFLDGVSPRFGRYEDAWLRSRAVELIAAVHSASTIVDHVAPVHILGFNGQRDLAELLDRPATRWDGGPFGERARGSFLAHAAALGDLLRRFDALAERTSEARAENIVVTHGEPHAANLMTVDEVVLLIDWDTVGLAPPERDLWMIVSEQQDARRYERATGHRIDADLLTLYELRWFLDDLGSAARMFRGAHVTDADTQRWIDAVDDQLTGIEPWAVRLDRR